MNLSKAEVFLQSFRTYNHLRFAICMSHEPFMSSELKKSSECPPPQLLSHLSDWLILLSTVFFRPTSRVPCLPLPCAQYLNNSNTLSPICYLQERATWNLTRASFSGDHQDAHFNMGDETTIRGLWKKAWTILQPWVDLHKRGPSMRCSGPHWGEKPGHLRLRKEVRLTDLLSSPLASSTGKWGSLRSSCGIVSAIPQVSEAHPVSF